MKNINKLMMGTLTLTLLTSCGKDSGSSSNSSKNTAPTFQEQQSVGNFRAILRPMNNQLSGFLPTGFAEVKMMDDQFTVKTLLDDDAKVPHMQSIHLGTRCPALADDKNGDGLIDINEAIAVSGDVLIPLDSDLSSVEEGAGIYPMGGGFTYSRTASLSKVESDVRARINQNLNMSGRVVLIHGVANGTQMPATVTVKETMSQAASIPIVCGVLKKEEE